MRKIAKPAPPPNPVARSLSDSRYRAQVVKTKRAYSRKIKHKKGSNHPDAPLQFVGSWRPEKLQQATSPGSCASTR